MLEQIRTVALTGATGTLGLAVIRQCLKKGIRVIAFVNPDSRNLNRIPEDPLIETVPCSLDQMESFETGNRKADAFIHLAWGHTNRAVRNLMKPQVDNIRTSVDSVYLASRLGCKVYVGAGSQAEYGRKEGAIRETDYPAPESAYGMAKLCAGQMTRSICRELGIRHVWPRIFSTYGPYTQDTSILNHTIHMLLSGKAPELTACEQVWDFIYVDDAARALLLLAEMGRDGEIYHISSGETHTLRYFVEEVCRTLGTEIIPGFGVISYGAGTVMHLEGCIDKIRQETGFVPETAFREGVMKTIEWAKTYYET